MKKIIYSLGMLAFVVFMTGQSNAVLQCSVETQLPGVLTEDACFYNEILLNNIEYPDDLSERPQEVTAEVNGSGTLVLKSKKNSGFPRLIVLGDTTVTNYQYEPTTGNTTPWKGSLVIPYPTRLPNENNFYEEGADVEDGDNTRVEVIGAYQIGPDYDEFEFSNDAFVSFYVNRPDGTQIFYATELDDLDEIIENRESMNEIKWEISEDYCVVSGSVCTVKISEKINRIALVKPLQDTCPLIRIDNGSFSRAPECKIICNEGFGFDFDTQKCIPSENLKAQTDLTNKDIYTNTLGRSRQGYFRFRDSRGSQLEIIPGADDLSTAEQEFVDTKNAGVSGRLGNENDFDNNSATDSKESLWKQFQEFVWTTDTTGKYHKSSTDTVTEEENIIDRPASDDESADSETFAASSGGLLPSTGSGAFIALILTGLVTMGFALRKRRP